MIFFKVGGHFIFTGTTDELADYELSLLQLGMMKVADVLGLDGLHILTYRRTI